MNMNQKNKCGCKCDTCETESKKDNKPEKILVITWQRLISEGNTCPRCGSTENELDKAVIQLKKELNPLGIEVILKKSELTLEEFKKDPTKSNRILFNDRSLEDVINADTGQSKCCDVCGDEKCRTVETKGKTYEIIPAEMIVKAGLKMAADLTN